MPSIVDLISKTEKEAEDIRAEAQRDAKSVIEKAQNDADSDIAQAQSDVRREILLRRENAVHTGEKLAAEILDMRRNESARNCEESEKHIDKAVKYIIERLSV